MLVSSHSSRPIYDIVPILIQKLEPLWKMDRQERLPLLAVRSFHPMPCARPGCKPYRFVLVLVVRMFRTGISCCCVLAQKINIIYWGIGSRYNAMCLQCIGGTDILRIYRLTPHPAGERGPLEAPPEANVLGISSVCDISLKKKVQRGLTSVF